MSRKNIRQNYFNQIRKVTEEVDKAGEHGKHFRCIILMGDASTKQGFSFEEARNLISIFASQGASSQGASPYPNIILCGLMGMASLTDDTSRILAEFRSLKSLFDEARKLRADLLAAQDNDAPLREFEILSMGMSGDYPLAIEAGATHVRIGTAIFGPRV